MSVSLKKEKRAGNRNTDGLIGRTMASIIPMKWLSNPELGWNGGKNFKNMIEVWFWLSLHAKNFYLFEIQQVLSHLKYLSLSTDFQNYLLMKSS